MSKCAACDMPGQGYAHTCAGSGTFVAAEVRVSEEIETIQETWQHFDVRLSFRMRAADDQMVREKLNPLVTALLGDDLVEWGEFTVTPDAA